MPDNGIRCIDLIGVIIPSTTFTTVVGPVPAGKEWDIQVARATNIAGTASTFSLSYGTNGNQALAFNEVLPVPSASASGSKNWYGPDKPPLKAGTVIQARAGAANSVCLTVHIFERDIA